MTLLKNNVKRIFVLILALFASFGLVACKDDEGTLDPEKQISEALGSIALGDTNSLNQSFDLIAKTGKHGLTIEWSVVNVKGETATIDDTGDVPRVIITPEPYEEDEEGNQINEWGQATLRATVRIGDKSSFREWDLWIVRAPKVLNMPISEVLAQENNAVVGFTGTVLFVHGNGFYVADETGTIYVYTKPTNPNVLPGAVVSVEGTKIVAFGQPEIDRGYRVEVITKAPDTGFDYQSLAVDAYVPEVSWQPVTNYDAYGKIVNLSGKVTKGQYGNYENLEITDELTGEKVMIYHDSEKEFVDAVEANVDKYVKLTAITLSFHSTDKVWRILGYGGSVEEIDAPVYTAEDKLNLVGIKLETLFKGKEVVNDLALPTDSLFDSTVSWESKNTAVIGNDGKLTAPTEDTEVELVASVTLGAEVKDFTFKVLVKVPEAPKEATEMTVAELLEAIDNKDADYVVVEGVIIGRDSGGYFYLADETGVIYVRVKLTDHGVEIGDKVSVTAAGSIYNGTTRYNRQFAGDGVAEIEKLDDQKHESPFVAVAAQISDFDQTITETNLVTEVLKEKLFGKVFTIEGYFILVQSGSFQDLYLAESLDAGANKVRIYHSSMEVNALKTLIGKQVKITAVAYECNPSAGVWNLGFMGRDGDLEVTLSETDQEAIAENEIKAILPKDNLLVGDLSFFSKTAYKYILGDVTYEFTSNNTEVLGNDGKYAEPEVETIVELKVKATFSETHFKEFVFNLTAEVVVVSDPSLKYEFDFDGGATSYNDVNTDFRNLVDNKNVTFSSHRVAYNTTTSVPGATKGMVLGPRLGDNDGISWAEFSFGTDVITSMSFDCYFWNNKAEALFTKIELQVKVDDVWTTIKDLKTEIAGETTIINISVDGFSGSVFRFYAEGGKENANDARCVIDNLKAHITISE
jgi:uncharacterized protein YdeI (BOF family)